MSFFFFFIVDKMKQSTYLRVILHIKRKSTKYEAKYLFMCYFTYQVQNALPILGRFYPISNYC